jgi:hypothetical protein
MKLGSPPPWKHLGRSKLFRNVGELRPVLHPVIKQEIPVCFGYAPLAREIDTDLKMPTRRPKNIKAFIFVWGYILSGLLHQISAYIFESLEKLLGWSCQLVGLHHWNNIYWARYEGLPAGVHSGFLTCKYVLQSVHKGNCKVVIVLN